MDIIKLDLENMTEDEVRAKLREFDFELPSSFDFGQHASISFNVKLGIVVAVEKRAL